MADEVLSTTYTNGKITKVIRNTAGAAWTVSSEIPIVSTQIKNICDTKELNALWEFQIIFGPYNESTTVMGGCFTFYVRDFTPTSEWTALGTDMYYQRATSHLNLANIIDIVYNDNNLYAPDLYFGRSSYVPSTYSLSCSNLGIGLKLVDSYWYVLAGCGNPYTLEKIGDVMFTDPESYLIGVRCRKIKFGS